MNKIHYYTFAELRNMDDETLLKISLERNRYGKYSANANKAMSVRNERSGVYYNARRVTSAAEIMAKEKGKQGFYDEIE